MISGVSVVAVVDVTTIKNKMEIEICHILMHEHNIKAFILQTAVVQSYSISAESCSH